MRQVQVPMLYRWVIDDPDVPLSQLAVEALRELPTVLARAGVVSVAPPTFRVDGATLVVRVMVRQVVTWDRHVAEAEAALREGRSLSPNYRPCSVDGCEAQAGGDGMCPPHRSTARKRARRREAVTA